MSKDKVEFILGLYGSDDFTEEQRKEIYEMRIDIIDAVVKYYNEVIDFDEKQPDPKHIPKAKEHIKSQLLEVIQKQHEMYNEMDKILHQVWDQLKQCLNSHISEGLRLRRESFRTDWTNCCPDDLKEIARKLAIHLCKKQLIDNVEHLTDKIRIACSVVISYYLIQLEWVEITLGTLNMKGPSDWRVPIEWNSKKYINIIPFTVMCWINERFGFDDKYKKKMVNIIDKFIVGIASKGTYDNIDLKEYHTMILRSGEFVDSRIDSKHILPAVRGAMLNDQRMAAENLRTGGKRNHQTHRRIRRRRRRRTRVNRR